MELELSKEKAASKSMSMLLAVRDKMVARRDEKLAAVAGTLACPRSCKRPRRLAMN